MKLFKLILVTLIGIFFFSQAKAQYSGVNSINNKKIRTIKYVKDNANKLDRSDKAVKLQGYIIEQINTEDFWFQDATGKIEIEIEPENMPKIPFNEKTELIIIGEVDSDWLEGVEIEVDEIQFVKPKKKKIVN